MNATFSTRDHRLAAGLFALVGLGLWVYYTYGIRPLWQTVSRLGNDVDTVGHQLQEVERALAQESQLRQQQRQLTEETRTLRTTLPTEEQLPSVLERLSDVAGQTGVKIQSLSPQRSVQNLGSVPSPSATLPALYKEATVQIEAVAGFHQLGTFLSRIETGDQPMQLRSLRVSANPKSLRRHAVKMTLGVYVAQAEATPAATGASSGSRTGLAEQQNLYDAKGKRDPFVPLVREGRFIGHTATPSAGASSADLLLGGIVWDPTGHSLALINETEVQVGESVSGYRVMEIRPDSVVLVRDGKPVVLQISFEDRVTSPE